MSAPTRFFSEAEVRALMTAAYHHGYVGPHPSVAASQGAAQCVNALLTQDAKLRRVRYKGGDWMLVSEAMAKELSQQDDWQLEKDENNVD